MTGAPGETSAKNYYDELFTRLSAHMPVSFAVESVAEAYLDGKPQARGKRRFTRRERDELLWSSQPVVDCPPESWSAEVIVLALARYLGQERVSSPGLVSRVAQAAPAALVRAVRYSGLVLKQHSPRRTELEQAAAGHAELVELCRVLAGFDLAYRDRAAAVAARKAALINLSAFDVLIFASLYAFERLVPKDFETRAPTSVSDTDLQVSWEAVNDLLAWKLETA